MLVQIVSNIMRQDCEKITDNNATDTTRDEQESTVSKKIVIVNEGNSFTNFTIREDEFTDTRNCVASYECNYCVNTIESESYCMDTRYSSSNGTNIEEHSVQANISAMNNCISQFSIENDIETIYSEKPIDNEPIGDQVLSSTLILDVKNVLQDQNRKTVNITPTDYGVHCEKIISTGITVTAIQLDNSSENAPMLPAIAPNHQHTSTTASTVFPLTVANPMYDKMNVMALLPTTSVMQHQIVLLRRLLLSLPASDSTCHFHQNIILPSSIVRTNTIYQLDTNFVSDGPPDENSLGNAYLSAKLVLFVPSSTSSNFVNDHQVPKENNDDPNHFSKFFQIKEENNNNTPGIIDDTSLSMVPHYCDYLSTELIPSSTSSHFPPTFILPLRYCMFVCQD